MKVRVIPIAIACVVALAATVAGQAPATDALFATFFAAEDPAAAATAAEAIVAAGVDFDTALARLRKGRSYLDEKRGEYSLRWRSKSGPFFNNVVEVPADYDPSQQVAAARAVARRRRPAIAERRGARTPARAAGCGAGRAPNRIEGEKQIYLHPSGWMQAQWWDEEQVDNILRAVDTLKRKYNIDETQIYVTGISDGGTGVYYLALKEPNLWSSYLPLNGSLAVLRNPADRRRRRDARQQLRQRAALCRERRERSALSGGAGRAAHGVVEAHGREPDVPAAGRRRPQHRVVAHRARAVRDSSCTIIRAPRIRRRCRGRPSASIGSIAIAG